MELLEITDGIYPHTKLNGWKLVSEEPPPMNQGESILLGYVTDRDPRCALCYGVGHRDMNYCYWLGARGFDPNYTRLENWQVIIWLPVTFPRAFNDTHRALNDYITARQIVGDSGSS